VIINSALFSGALLAAICSQLALSQDKSLTLPQTVEAGSAFSIQSTGSGKATLLIVGLGQVIKRDMQLGQTISFPSGTLYNAGRYVTVLERESSPSPETGAFNVLPSSKPAEINFLARPSRLQVGLRGGITGAAYLFDSYHNLVTVPTPVSFELSNPVGATQKRTATTKDGAAWTELDSTAQQGIDKFVARAGDVSSMRIIGQVPGDPCGLKMSAQPDGRQVHVKTEPVKDCSGNAVPDGTIVTFTETYGDAQSTVDVPLKRGIAEVKLPAHPGARISVASGVVLGNEIRWGN
jgi:hypothetical protein